MYYHIMENTPAGNDGRLFVWLREAESFPPAPASDAVRDGYGSPELAVDYTGIVESSLASLYLNSQHFMAPGGELFVTGGPSGSLLVLRRVAAIFRRRTVALSSGGAALGAAATAACLWNARQEGDFDPDQYCGGLLDRGSVVEPDSNDITAFHGENGMLSRYSEVEARLVRG